MSVSALGLFVTLASCDVDLGPREQPPSPPRTLGQIIYGEACQRIAYTADLADYAAGVRTTLDVSGVEYRPMCLQDAPPPANAPQIMQEVAAQESAIVGNIDTVVPSSLYDPLDQALRASVPALDGNSAALAVAGAGSVFAAIAADPASVGAVTRLGLRVGYRPRSLDGALVRGALAYPQLSDNISAALPAIWPSTDSATDAPGAAGRPTLLTGISRELGAATAVPNVNVPDRSARLVANLMLTEMPELSTGQSYFAVLRDARGAPLLTTLAAPYVDKDGDGLADLDFNGHFVDATGKALPAISPFSLLDLSKMDYAAGRDMYGRAMTTAAGPALLYRYQNLDDTVLAGAFREASALFDPTRDIPLRMLRGASYLLGPRVPAHRDYAGQSGVDYTGFDQTQSPLLDMLSSYLQLLTYTARQNGQGMPDGSGADLGQLLRGTELLLINQEPAMSLTFDALGKAFDESHKPDYAAAQVPATSTLFDDLAPILVRIFRNPALVSDLITALGDPATADLGQIAAILATDSSLVFMNQAQLDYTVSSPSPIVGSLGKPVLRNQPDSDVDLNPTNPQNNRSIMQRLLHVLHNTNGVRLCNKQGAYVNFKLLLINITIAGPAAPCALYDINDVASYFMLSIASQSIKSQDPSANFLNSLVDGTLKTGAQALDLVGSLGSFVGIPNFSSYPAPQQLGRILFQTNANRSAFFQTTMDFGQCLPARDGTLCSNQNTSLQAYHDGVLFALEAVHPKDANGNPKTNVNFYTAFQPIVNAFAKYQECVPGGGPGPCSQKRNAVKILVDLLSVLHRHWPTVQSTIFNISYEPQAKHDGLSNYEPLVAAVMGQGDLWPATVAVAPLLASTKLDDGSNLPVAQATARFLQWFFDPEALRLGGPLAFRDGRQMALRNDGTPTFTPTMDPVIGDVLAASDAGKVTPYDLLADAYNKKHARFATDATGQELATEYSGAVSALYDELLARPSPMPTALKFYNPRVRPLLLAFLDYARQRVASHGMTQDFPAWAQQSLYPSLQNALLGPVVAGAADTLGPVHDVPAALTGLSQLLSTVYTDPGPGMPATQRFQSVLTLTADVMQLFLDDADMVPVLHAIGMAADPQNGALDGFGAVVRRAIPADTQKTLITVGQSMYQGDSSGRYPAYYLADVITAIDRPNAGDPTIRGTDFSASDEQGLYSTIGQFLSDEDRGVLRLVNIIRARTSVGN